MTSPSKDSKTSSNGLSALLAGAFVTGCTAFWFTKVNSIVPDPYLVYPTFSHNNDFQLIFCHQDEVFHVRQAQVYCKSEFHVWDPKITTPPGLYLISWLIYQVTGRCSITDLRALNVVTIVLGYLLTYGIVQKQKSTRRLTAANIWLFPPLFFFSALYYTDVQSAFWTILAYRSYQRYEQRDFASWGDAIFQVILGIIALFFRQTNIFWVAIFPAGLALISSATKLSPRTPGAFGGTQQRDQC